MASNTGEPRKSGTRPGWHHVGADIPITLFQKLQEQAKKDLVGYSTIIRWALSDYLNTEDS